MSGRAHIGTSGFSYPHWRGLFYPKGVPQRLWLEYYAERFETVELNNTFYAMPRAAHCRAWRLRTPRGFTFVVKLNQLITHRKRLRNCAELMAGFLDAAGHLGEKLGPILVQLPPRMRADPARLDDFAGLCPAGLRLAAEFRDPTWLGDPVYAVLRRRGIALVVHDLIADHPHEVTADFVYLRFHGPGGGDTSYSPRRLAAEARRVRAYLEDGLDVYVYFNNDVGGHALRNARDLKRYVSG